MKFALVLAMLTSPALAEEVKYVTPRIPTEAEKVEALQLGYILNGFSMVRHPSQGSIDVTGYQTPIPGVVRTIPIDPSKKKGAQVSTFKKPAKETDAEYADRMKRMAELLKQILRPEKTK